jgi:hypothetical protein
MEIIRKTMNTQEDLPKYFFVFVDMENIWLSYWNGESEGVFELPTMDGRRKFEVDILWEYLIEGRIQLVE